MPCVKCGKGTRVTDSRPTSDSVYRRRICPEGHRFTTTEVFVKYEGVGKNSRMYAADKKDGRLDNEQQG